MPTEQHAIDRVNQQIFDNSVDLLLVVDRKGTFIRVSPSSMDILGYEPSEMVGHSATEFLYPSDLENTREMMRQSRRGHITRHFDCRYLHKEGGIKLLTWTGTWSERDQQHFFIGRDITEARALEQLDYIEQQLKAIGISISGWSGAKSILKLADYCWVMESMVVANSLWACWVLLTPPSNFDKYSDAFLLARHLTTNEFAWGIVAGAAAILAMLGLVGSLFRIKPRVALTSRCVGLLIAGGFWFCMGISTVVGNPDTLFGVPGGVFPGAVACIVAMRLMMFL